MNAALPHRISASYVASRSLVWVPVGSKTHKKPTNHLFQSIKKTEPKILEPRARMSVTVSECHIFGYHLSDTAKEVEVQSAWLPVGLAPNLA